jgi:hypothetical protein
MGHFGQRGFSPTRNTALLMIFSFWRRLLMIFLADSSSRRRQGQSCILRVQFQWARHGGERRRRRRQGRGGEDDVAAGVRVLHGSAHRSREGLSLSLFCFKFAVDSAGDRNGWGERLGWVRRRRRYRRSPRRAPRASRGGAASLPTSSAPMPRLLLQSSTSVVLLLLVLLGVIGTPQFSLQC